MKNRIIFVDDEPGVLLSYQRMLRDKQDEWDMVFVSNGADALDVLENGQYDVIVADLLMPGMTGIQLLNWVRKLYPGMTRIVLSGNINESTEKVCAMIAHQILSKPCSTQDLKDAITRAFMLQTELEGVDLKRTVSEMSYLPSLPEQYKRLMYVLHSADGSLQEAGDVVCRDVAMAAKVLQIVNSASLGLRRMVYDPVQAVVYIGMEKLKQFVLSGHIFNAVEGNLRLQQFLEKLWRHSYLTGIYARKIAESLGKDKEFCNIAFSAGVLHDVGKIIFAEQYLDRYMSVVDKVRATHEFFSIAERDNFGASHGEIGAYLLNIWGLPSRVVNVIQYHHTPRMSNDVNCSPLTVVHMANVYSSKKVFGEDARSVLDVEYLYGAGLYPKIAEMEQLCANVATVT
jgi:putative nucleotidyltransferase with HDIG domain